MHNYIYIQTYGCSANQNNSEILAGILRQSGYQLTNNEKIADILIINTCIVKGKTEQKIKRRIQNLSKLYKNKQIIIAGCMSQTDFNSLKKINPKLIFLGVHHLKDVLKLLRDFNENILTSKEQSEYLSKRNEEKILLSKISKNKLISIIQISEGCLGECKFCKTRLAKGTLFSYDKEKIIKQIESDLRAGAKEIWLTSQDNASYGLDKLDKKPLFPELLNEILKLKHNFKLRLGMMNPNNVYPILNELIEIYQNKKMYKFFHIPIQSASNKVLKDMNRQYKIEIAEEIINKFKKQFPNLTLATDIITGYPTETEQDHKNNIEFLKHFKPDVLNLSKFSLLKGTEIYNQIKKSNSREDAFQKPLSVWDTEAGKLIPLSKEIINKRATELMQFHRETAMESKEKYKDKTIKVFINNKTLLPSVYEARDENYNIVLINSKDKSILGKTLEIKIKQIGVHHMIGEYLS